MDKNAKDKLRTLSLPALVIVVMLAMVASLFGPIASAQTGGDPYPPPGGSIGSITGRVVDSVTGAPVTTASVTLYRCEIMGCLYTIGTYVSGSGEFGFSQQPFGAPLLAGNYYIAISASRYESYTSPVFTVAEGEHRLLGNLPLVELPYVRLISGRVVDQTTGLPITPTGYGTGVFLYRCDEPYGCTTYSGYAIINMDGTFNLPGPPMYGLIPAGTYIIEAVIERYERTRTEPFTVAAGEERNIGTIALPPLPVTEAITGQVVDAVTKAPIPGIAAGGPIVSLYQCDTSGYCGNQIGSQNTDAEGRFRFASDTFGRTLLAGMYRIDITIDQYNQYNGVPFLAEANQVNDLGKVQVQPYPVRFTDVTPCENIPAGGGICRYSVRVTSGMTTTIHAAAWSIVSASAYPSVGTGGSSTFQPDPATALRLRPGRSELLRFSFRVPAGAQPGTTICTSAYVSKDVSTRLFNTIGQRALFCIVKTTEGGFRRANERETRFATGQNLPSNLIKPER